MHTSWYEMAEAWVDEVGEGPLPLRVPDELIAEPSPSMLEVAQGELYRAVADGAPVGRREAWRWLFAELLVDRDPLPLQCQRARRAGYPEDSPWHRAAAAWQEQPSVARWQALVDATPGDGPPDRVRRAIDRLLLLMDVLPRTVLNHLSRRVGPSPVLEPLARSGCFSQFEFDDRAQRTRVPEKKPKWLRLAIAAAEACGHQCCVFMFRMELEGLENPEGEGEILAFEPARSA